MNWEIFINVSSGVLGFLSAIIFIAILIIIASIAAAIPHLVKVRVITARLQPPFDDVEVSINDINRTVTARFIKKGVIVWQGNVPRKMLGDD